MTNFDYYLIVTGSHLLKKHGYTINEIKKDGIKIYKKFKMFEEKNDDSSAIMTEGFGKAITNLTKIIKTLKPDLIFSGFDIGANFAAAIIGAHMNIHVAHLEGGEITGTIDESIRHAVTKLSHIHFVANEVARNRLIQLGERKELIYIIGSPDVDLMSSASLVPIDNVRSRYEFSYEEYQKGLNGSPNDNPNLSKRMESIVESLETCR